MTELDEILAGKDTIPGYLTTKQKEEIKALVLGIVGENYVTTPETLLVNGELRRIRDRIKML